MLTDIHIADAPQHFIFDKITIFFYWPNNSALGVCQTGPRAIICRRWRWGVIFHVFCDTMPIRYVYLQILNIRKAKCVTTLHERERQSSDSSINMLDVGSATSIDVEILKEHYIIPMFSVINSIYYFVWMLIYLFKTLKRRCVAL